MKPNKALLRFHKQFCSHLSLDSPQVFYKLLEEINKLKSWSEGYKK